VGERFGRSGEFGAPTDGPAGTYVSQATQGQMITEGYKLWSTYPWAGPLFVFQGRDQGTDPSSYENFFGFINYDGTPKPGYFTYRQATETY
jgi:polysaccharide biosynthesis protein PslG